MFKLQEMVYVTILAMLIRFCLNLVSKSPLADKELRYNEKDGTGSHSHSSQPTETQGF